MIFVNWLNGSFLVLTVLLTHFLVSRIESRVSYSYMFYMCQKLNISYISQERIHIKMQQLDYLKLKIKDLLLVLFYVLKTYTYDMYISLYVQMAIVVFLELK